MEDEIVQINSKENKTTFKQKLKGFFENIFSSWKKTTLYTGAVLLVLCILLPDKDMFFSCYHKEKIEKKHTKQIILNT